jgi:hypothetical protein
LFVLVSVVVITTMPASKPARTLAVDDAASFRLSNQE